MGELQRRGQCPECAQADRDTAKDNLAVYENGAYCFSCGYTTKEENMSTEETIIVKKKARPLIPIGEYRPIKNRGVTLETAKKFKTTITKYDGHTVMCTSYHNKGAIVAQKLKFKKDSGMPKCMWLGDRSTMPPLWGMDLWEPNPKLSITICEGEPDMLCRSSLNQDKWPVVSLLDGAGKQAIKNIAKAKEYLSGFKRIVLMFDGDQAGRSTATAAAELLGSKARIVSMPDGEDVCSMYQKGRGDEINRLEMLAVAVRPDNIITVDDYTDEELYKVDKKGLHIVYPKLNKMLRGLRPEALYMFTAGSGCGKSTVVKEMSYELMFNQDIKVGCIYLEESDKSAMKGYIAMHNDIEATEFRDNPDLISQKSKDEARKILSKNGVFFKHFGSLPVDSLIAKVEYMISGCDCQVVILDHISLAISGNETDNERKSIDVLMTKLRTTIQKTGRTVLAISHISRPKGDSKDANNGGKINITNLRGSASLEQLSDVVVALEREQFSENSSTIVQLKVLKNRLGGVLGYCDTLDYDTEIGRLRVKENEREKYDKMDK